MHEISELSVYMLCFCLIVFILDEALGMRWRPDGQKMAFGFVATALNFVQPQTCQAHSCTTDVSGSRLRCMCGDERRTGPKPSTECHVNATAD